MLKHSLRKVGQYIKHYGPVGLTRKVLERRMTRSDYDTERLKEIAGEDELLREKDDLRATDPLISILVPVYEPDRIPFMQMLTAVREQSYIHWQLCLADASENPKESIVNLVFDGDARVTYMHLPTNGGIVGNTNKALNSARGAYVAFLDQDDIPEPNALYEVVAKIREGADFIYTDEDKVDHSLQHYERPFRKPDYNETLLRTTNYICHFTVIRTDIVRRLGGLRAEYEGAQDYDLVLRASREAKQIAHVAKVLYHWRSSEGSTSANPFTKQYAFDAGARALFDALHQSGLTDYAVSQGENPGYYRIALTGIAPLTATIVNAGEPVPDKINEDYVLVMTPAYHLHTGGLQEMLARAYLTDADIVAPRQICRKKYLYNGIAAAGEGHTISLAGRPSWHHGPYQCGVVNMDVDVTPIRGILVRASLLPEVLRLTAGHINRKTEWSRDLRMVYAPEVTLSKDEET